MTLDTNTTIILLSQLVILSYLFNILSRWTRIPSVLLLMATGIGLKYLSDFIGINVGNLTRFVPFLGTVGLIMIVLESTLDLELRRDRIKLIRNSFFTALLILLISSVIVAAIIYFTIHHSIRDALVYGTVLSVISSSIVLPSVQHLATEKREFMVYEATFSDILGIVLFGFLTLDTVITPASAAFFSVRILVMVIVSALASLMLIYFISAIRSQVKVFLIFALLVLMYAYGKMYHLPSLMLVFFFGLIIANFHAIGGKTANRFIRPEVLQRSVHQLGAITAETAFLVRTFFFLLFGFSIDVSVLLEEEVIIIGSVIVAALLAVRFIYLKFITRGGLFPELFIMPRGLITIVLFYTIPEQFKIGHFNEGILFFVIVATGVLMMIGLMLSRDKKEQTIEASEQPQSLI
jgi:Kef-type K+ transport system membrane component KefB